MHYLAWCIRNRSTDDIHRGITVHLFRKSVMRILISLSWTNAILKVFREWLPHELYFRGLKREKGFHFWKQSAKEGRYVRVLTCDGTVGKLHHSSAMRKFLKLNWGEVWGSCLCMKHTELIYSIPRIFRNTPEKSVISRVSRLVKSRSAARSAWYIRSIKSTGRQLLRSRSSTPQKSRKECL